MDPRLLQYYNIELQHLREMGAEFAEQFPKIAARLGMNGLEVSDPYVERLIEGVGFLAARVHLKLDAEFPRFTQALLETIYPHYLAPTPSMLVAQLHAGSERARTWRRASRCRAAARCSGVKGADDPTACEFRTSQDVALWPIEIVSASYFSYAPDLPLTALPVGQRIKGGLRIRLRTTAGLKFSQTGHRSLAAVSDRAQRRGQPAVRAVSRGRRSARWRSPARVRRAGTSCCPRASIRPVGFADSEALLPVTLRSFQGYRLLQEYFSFPQRFRFLEIVRVCQRVVRRVDGNEIELVAAPRSR